MVCLSSAFCQTQSTWNPQCTPIRHITSVQPALRGTPNTSSSHGGPAPPDFGSSSSSPWLRRNTGSRGKTGPADTDGFCRPCSALQESRCHPYSTQAGEGWWFTSFASLVLVTEAEVRNIYPSAMVSSLLPSQAVPWRKQTYFSLRRPDILSQMLHSEPRYWSTTRRCTWAGISAGRRKSACTSPRMTTGQSPGNASQKHWVPAPASDWRGTSLCWLSFKDLFHTCIFWFYTLICIYISWICKVQIQKYLSYTTNRALQMCTDFFSWVFLDFLAW